MKKSTLLLSTAVALAAPLTAAAEPFVWEGVAFSDVEIGQLNVDDVRAETIATIHAGEADGADVGVATSAYGNSDAVVGADIAIDDFRAYGWQTNHGAATATTRLDVTGARADFDDVSVRTVAVANSRELTADGVLDDAIVFGEQENAPFDRNDDVVARTTVAIAGDVEDDFDVVTVATANTVSVDVEDGLFRVDTLQQNDADVVATARVTADDIGSGEIITMASGNAVAVDSGSGVADLDMMQLNRDEVDVRSTIALGDVDRIEIVTAGFGNDISADVGGDLSLYRSFQFNDDEVYVSASVELDEARRVDIDTVAAGNSASLRLDGDFFRDIAATQENRDDVRARTHVTMDAVRGADISVSTHAIGNAASFSVNNAD